MKNLKLNLSALALILGVTAAAAGAATRNTDERKWGFDQSSGEYVEVTNQSSPLDYQCTGQENICTETYPADVNPNDQENDEHDGEALPISVVPGNFSN